MPFQDLAEAWKADRFKSLDEKLCQVLEDARSGGQDFRIMMPDSEKPSGRLRNWRRWLAQYGRFLDGEPPGPAQDSDRIRQYVLEHYIEPAREEGQGQVEIQAREVNGAIGLDKEWPMICQVLAGHKFREMAQVSLPERVGPDNSPDTVLRFDLIDQLVDRPALEEMRERFLAFCPDFKSFVDPGAGWARDEKAFKVDVMEQVQTALTDACNDEALGETVFNILMSQRDGPLVRWQTRDRIARQNPELLDEFHAVIGRLVRSDKSAEEALSHAFDSLMALRGRGVTSLTFGERLNILFSALSVVRPGEAVPVKITRMNKAWEKLVGRDLFGEKSFNLATDYRSFKCVFAELFAIMHDDWQWQPQDWLDIQGFLWIALEEVETEDHVVVKPTDNGASRERPVSALPVNLILYGPPGTGKTYCTAAEAVRLCGEAVPEDRDALMQTYQRLLSAGRIEFVTFHQSMSYEDFVEGRQPTTESDEDGTCSSGGFRLETVPGIFRRIAKRAETSRSASLGDDAITIAGRQVFKMSIGETGNPDDAPLFEEAIAGGYTLLGFEDIDWSDDKYVHREAIIEACKTKGVLDGHNDVNARSSAVQLPYIFRNWVRHGDIVVVSKGNLLFRAIGEFTGDYEFYPRPEGVTPIVDPCVGIGWTGKVCRSARFTRVALRTDRSTCSSIASSTSLLLSVT